MGLYVAFILRRDFVQEPIIKAGDPTKPHDDEDREGRRGDLALRGVIASQTDCVLDIQVINQKVKLSLNSRSSTSTACTDSLKRGA